MGDLWRTSPPIMGELRTALVRGHSDRVYKRPRAHHGPRAVVGGAAARIDAWYAGASGGQASRAGARPGRPRRVRSDPLVREVRWRLFRREDLPARLRRLQRLEDAAFGAAPDGTARPAHDEAKPASR